nr:mucoidy inhibitor MuiA family protein [uncultured Porphyromonas sp.]
MKQNLFSLSKKGILCHTLALCTLLTGTQMHAQIAPEFEVKVPAQKELSEIKATPPIKYVTVFLSGAEVVREGSVSIPQGNSEIILTGISPYAEAKSVQVKLASRDVTVLSVNHMYDLANSGATSEEMAKWQKKLESLNEQIARISNKVSVVQDELAFLQENRSIKGTSSGINLANLKSVNDYYREQNLNLRNQKLELEKELKQLREKRDIVTKEISQQGKLDENPMGEVHIRVDAKRALSCPVELSYYVENASWIPSYDLRSSGLGKPLELSYKATIHQATREDWNRVHLTISSLDPKISNTPPTQKTYYLNYNTPAPRYTQNKDDQASGMVLFEEDNEPIVGASVRIAGTNIGTMTDLNGKYSITIPSSGGSLEISYIGCKKSVIPITSQFTTTYLESEDEELQEVVVAGYAAGISMDMAVAKEEAPSASRKMRSSAGERNSTLEVKQDERQTAVEFELQTPYSIPSDKKPFILEVKRYSLPATYEYICVPKADPDAFLLAHIGGWEQYKLLSGEVNIFYENSFVGKTILDTRSLTDTLQVSLGRDKGIRVTREKEIEKNSSRFLSSKTEETRSWNTTLRNGKSTPIEITLYDQVPVSTNDEISVRAENISGGEYNPNTGEVKWKLKLNPSESKTLNLKYIVKSPKEKKLHVE